MVCYWLCSYDLFFTFAYMYTCILYIYISCYFCQFPDLCWANIMMLVSQSDWCNDSPHGIRRVETNALRVQSQSLTTYEDHLASETMLLLGIDQTLSCWSLHEPSLVFALLVISIFVIHHFCRAIDTFCSLNQHIQCLNMLNFQILGFNSAWWSHPYL